MRYEDVGLVGLCNVKIVINQVVSAIGIKETLEQSFRVFEEKYKHFLQNPAGEKQSFNDFWMLRYRSLKLKDKGGLRKYPKMSYSGLMSDRT